MIITNNPKDGKIGNNEVNIYVININNFDFSNETKKIEIKF